MAEQRKDSKGRVLRKGESQRKDGYYCFRYTDIIGKRRTVYAVTLEELREKEDDLKLDSLVGIDSYKAGHSDINYLFDLYLDTKTNLRDTTIITYRYLYDKYVRDTFGKKIVNTVKYSDVVRFYGHLHNEVKVSVSTIKHIHRLIYPAFALAVRDDILRKNPCEDAMQPICDAYGGEKKDRSALTKEEQKEFMEFVTTDPRYSSWKPLFVFLFGTGCRIGETIGIRWEDIDFENRRIDINHTVSYRPSYGDKFTCEFVVHPPKTKQGYRQIPMNGDVYDALLEECAFQEEFGGCEAEVGGMSGFVFFNRFGNLHNPGGVNKAIERIRLSHNAKEVLMAAKEEREPIIIPHFCCHQIRHTFCTRLCEAEGNLKVIQTIMGHSDIRTTMDIYAEATQDGITAAMDRLAESMRSM